MTTWNIVSTGDANWSVDSLDDYVLVGYMDDGYTDAQTDYTILTEGSTTWQ